MCMTTNRASDHEGDWSEEQQYNGRYEWKAGVISRQLQELNGPSDIAVLAGLK